MNIFNVITLFGGLAMFLYGMRMMGDGLKNSSSGTLKKAMERITGTPIKAFLLGLTVTAVVQSSTATIVLTSGLVGAGIISLGQSLGIIIGANVGTTITGQIIRLLDLNSSGTWFLQFLKPSTLAPLALIIGIVIIMGMKSSDSAKIGHIIIGFRRESPPCLSVRSGRCLCPSKLLCHHWHPAGFFHIRPADFWRDLYCIGRCLLR